MTRTRRVQKLINERFRTVPYTTLCARTFRPDHDVRVYTLGFTYHHHRRHRRSFGVERDTNRRTDGWIDRSINRRRAKSRTNARRVDDASSRAARASAGGPGSDRDDASAAGGDAIRPRVAPGRDRRRRARER